MSKTSKIRAIIYGVLVSLVLFEAFDFFGGYDYIKAAIYKPTTEVENIINNIDLTDRGNRTLRATFPKLETRDVFNEKCDSHSNGVYILGCYQTAEDSIHLYNINEEELLGVKESTMAHELLHAAYSRLHFWEKSSLNDLLKKYYDSLPEDNEIKESMKLYDEKDFYDELHSRLGTEVKELPLELEKHYESFFNDQDKVVSYYEKYSGVFKKYEKETKELSEKIVKLKSEIDNEKKELEILADSLNARITDYNNRVNLKKYSSIDAIIKEGNNLQKEINSIRASSDSLSKKIAEHNKLIEEYNNSVVRTNVIYDSINSNSDNINELKN